MSILRGNTEEILDAIRQEHLHGRFFTGYILTASNDRTLVFQGVRQFVRSDDGKIEPVHIIIRKRKERLIYITANASLNDDLLDFFRWLENRDCKSVYRDPSIVQLSRSRKSTVPYNTQAP